MHNTDDKEYRNEAHDGDTRTRWQRIQDMMFSILGSIGVILLLITFRPASCFRSSGPPEDLRIAEIWDAAEAGDVDAQLAIATTCLSTNADERDSEQGMYWLQRAAEQSTVAQEILALVYAEGVHVQADAFKALKWLLLAADNGSATADAEVRKIVSAWNAQWREDAGDKHIAQTIFDRYHFIGDASTVAITGLSTTDDELILHCTVHWQGPIVADGLTKVDVVVLNASGALNNGEDYKTIIRLVESNGKTKADVRDDLLEWAEYGIRLGAKLGM